jgi:hypothetical protein
MKNFKSIVFLLLLLPLISLKAQNTVVNSEVGIFLGPTFFQGDFGEAGNFKSSTANVGMGFEFAYIMDFSDSRYHSMFFQNLAEHIKQRLQISYSKIKSKHNPIPVSNTSSEYLNFGAMVGESKIFSIGTISEIYIFSIVKKPYKLEPYLSLGISYNMVTPSISSTLPLPSVYTTGSQKVFNNKQNALSFTYGVGTRYRLNGVDLIFEGNMRSFLSDRIDGLDPEIPGDKNNDSMVSFRLGAVFHIDGARR